MKNTINKSKKAILKKMDESSVKVDDAKLNLSIDSFFDKINSAKIGQAIDLSSDELAIANHMLVKNAPQTYAAGIQAKQDGRIITFAEFDANGTCIKDGAIYTDEFIAGYNQNK